MEIVPPVIAPSAQKTSFDIEDTLNASKANVQDVEIKKDLEKEKDMEVKETREEPKEGGAPSGEAIGAHEVQTSADKEPTNQTQDKAKHNSSAEDKGKGIESD